MTNLGCFDGLVMVQSLLSEFKVAVDLKATGGLRDAWFLFASEEFVSLSSACFAWFSDLRLSVRLNPWRWKLPTIPFANSTCLHRIPPLGGFQSRY